MTIAMLVAACAGTPLDRRADVDRLTARIRALPGVVAATDELADSPAQNLVFFRIGVDVADDITADELAAVTATYLQDLHTVDYSGYQSELDARRRRNIFAVDSSALPITNTEQIIAQARQWIALLHTFQGATIGLRATIAHPGGQLLVQEMGQSNVASLELPDAADYTVVAAAVTTLSGRFAQLAALNWVIRAGKDHPSWIETSRQLPTAGEMAVWNKLNADQSVAHIDRLRINSPFTPAVWFSEQTQSRDVVAALQLARQHLPLVATLPAPVLYTASDQISGHIGYYGHAGGPVAITVGGCTRRDGYQPTEAERVLIRTYEKCPTR